MFQCRMCSENPFSSMMGAPPGKSEEKKKKKGTGEGTKRKSVSKRDMSAFNARTEAEVREAVERWKEYAHPRAKEFFSTPEQLEEVLIQLAKGTDKNDDPILGPDEKCVYWYGDVTKDDLQAAIRMIKPGEQNESVTYVNRVLAFIFATDDSFVAAAVRSLATALRSGPRDRTAERRKEFELLRHLAANAFPWAAEDVIREIETFASRKTFMKVAGGVKRQLLEMAAREAPKGLVVVGVAGHMMSGSFCVPAAVVRACALVLTRPTFGSKSPAEWRRTAAKGRWEGPAVMPVKIVKQDDLRRQYPPNGIPTAKNQTADDFLFQACQYSVSMGNLDRAIKKGANVNARNKDGNTPLMLACQNWTGSQFLPFINKLLESKADVNVESGWGFTPLDKVTELLKDQEAARLQEIRAQEERREIMEGRSIVGYGYGTAEEQRQHLVPNQPLADELDTFKCLPQLRECKKLLEQKGAKPGQNPFNPAYLTTEEFVERRDAILEKYKDAKFKYSGH
ncbi:Ankrd53 [Symbiodinium sp. CCMP2592]|nr:Ankrd53 [Symbiodinium sp. CCMP2592]